MEQDHQKENVITADQREQWCFKKAVSHAQHAVQVSADSKYIL